MNNEFLVLNLNFWSEVKDLNKLRCLKIKAKFIFCLFWKLKSSIKQINKWFKQESNFYVLINDNWVEIRMFFY
jgi:hypothetical protein